MIQIKLNNVSKSFGSVNILKDVSLEILDGEFVVIVGPSGCGKSTLLRMIAGLEDTTSGEILIAGINTNGMPAKERDIAMVFQSYALYPHMNVSENMSFALKLARVSKTEIKKRVLEAAEILGLESLLKRLPRELSGGQRQRVAMGRAIVRNPSVFLFDEPLSNLDARLRVRMRAEIKKLHHRLGKAVVYVTHDQTEAMSLADKVVVLNAGDIAQVGKPQDLYENPCSEFVASFIGSPEINLIPAMTLGVNERFVSLDKGIRMPINMVLDLPLATAVSYGIRPQHLRLSEEGVAAEVVLVESTGEDTELTVNLAGHEVSILVHELCKLKTGDWVNLQPDINRVLIFDSDSGERLI